MLYDLFLHRAMLISGDGSKRFEADLAIMNDTAGNA